MENKEIKTKVKGLDVLLNWDKDTLRDDSMLIVLRGERGINKMNLAMQMMKGFSECLKSQKMPMYCSLDKNLDVLMKKYESINGNHPDSKSVFFVPQNEKDSYHYSKLLRFNAIMQRLESIKIENEDGKKDGGKLPCVVIEGFAGLSSEDFARLPMDSLEERLKEKANVAILVFDNRLSNFNTGADIIIEMRRAFSAQHNYTHYELQISKNIFSPAAIGWHKYRCEDNGKVVVYPSLHKILSKLQPKRSEFERLLTNPKQCPINGIECDGHQALDFFQKLNKKVGRNNDTENKPLTVKDVLYPSHVAISSIIGANNTFKRLLAAKSVVEALKNGERVLVMLFNEHRAGFKSLLEDTDKYCFSNAKLHFYEMAMGCLSPDEFIDMIQRYVDAYKKSVNDKIHIYMIDLVAIDYAFPMLQAETLFLPALATICKQREISLTMVCNKRFSLVDEVCFVSDIVLCTERENGTPPNQLTLYLEKNAFGQSHSSRVYKWEIADVTKTDEWINAGIKKQICTTKDFWRQTWNIRYDDRKIDKNKTAEGGES